MGDIANQLIEDEMFGCGDYFYPKTVWVKRTPSQSKIASIRKEIAIAVQSGVNINDARKQANIKYGHGWRERGLTNNPNSQWSEECLAPFTSKRDRNKKQSLSLKNL